MDKASMPQEERWVTSNLKRKLRLQEAQDASFGINGTRDADDTNFCQGERLAVIGLKASRAILSKLAHQVFLAWAETSTGATELLPSLLPFDLNLEAGHVRSEQDTNGGSTSRRDDHGHRMLFPCLPRIGKEEGAGSRAKRHDSRHDIDGVISKPSAKTLHSNLQRTENHGLHPNSPIGSLPRHTADPLVPMS